MRINEVSSGNNKKEKKMETDGRIENLFRNHGRSIVVLLYLGSFVFAFFATTSPLAKLVYGEDFRMITEGALVFYFTVLLASLITAALLYKVQRFKQ